MVQLGFWKVGTKKATLFFWNGTGYSEVKLGNLNHGSECNRDATLAGSHRMKCGAELNPSQWEISVCTQIGNAITVTWFCDWVTSGPNLCCLDL